MTLEERISELLEEFFEDYAAGILPDELREVRDDYAKLIRGYVREEVKEIYSLESLLALPANEGRTTRNGYRRAG